MSSFDRYRDKEEEGKEEGKNKIEEHSCSCDVSSSNNSVRQTLDEMDFERGIWYAAQQNDIDRVHKLLRKNVVVGVAGCCPLTNEKDNAGYTALHYASRNGHLEVCKILLDNGADVNSVTRSGNATSLHRSATQGHIDVVRLLLNANANSNIRDSDGFTPLHRAVNSQSLDVVKILIGTTDIKIKDNKGRDPRQLAAQLGFRDIVDCFSCH